MAVNNIIHFHNYHTITFYTLEGVDGRMKIVPLTSLGFSLQESIKVKILDNTGLDIARSGEDFISDVTLTPDLHKYCTNIAPAQYRQLQVVRNNSCVEKPFHHVDYSSERYWALTSRLRGYHVSFIYNFDLDSHRFSVRPINRIRLKALVAWCSIDYSDEDDSEVSDDSVVDTEEECEYSPERAQWWQAPFHDSLLGEESDTASEHSDYYPETDAIVQAVRSLARNCRTMLVVEHNEGREFLSRYDIRQVGKTLVLNFFDPDNACSCTVMMADISHTSAWDPIVHSDHGFYHGGVNLYSREGRHHGIILMGRQNGGNTFSYATSLEANIIVPDLAE